MFGIRLLVAAMLLWMLGCAPEDKPMAPAAGTDPWVIRTDFANESQWAEVKKLISAPQKDIAGEFVAYVKFVSDETYRAKATKDIVTSLPDNYPHKFCFIVDRECLDSKEQPVLVVGFYPSDGKSFDRPPSKTPAGDIKTFRALPSQIQGIENNLSIANMDFEDFAGNVDKDGVFRGFPR